MSCPIRERPDGSGAQCLRPASVPVALSSGLAVRACAGHAEQLAREPRVEPGARVSFRAAVADRLGLTAPDLDTATILARLEAALRQVRLAGSGGERLLWTRPGGVVPVELESLSRLDESSLRALRVALTDAEHAVVRAFRAVVLDR